MLGNGGRGKCLVRFRCQVFDEVDLVSYKVFLANHWWGGWNFFFIGDLGFWLVEEG